MKKIILKANLKLNVLLLLEPEKETQTATTRMVAQINIYSVSYAATELQHHKHLPDFFIPLGTFLSTCMSHKSKVKAVPTNAMQVLRQRRSTAPTHS
jgi:hypothetical protein